MTAKKLSQLGIALLTLIGAASCAPSGNSAPKAKACDVEILVLGTGQDAGIPQIGNPSDPAWKNPGGQRFATSIAVLDHRSGDRYLFEATPDIREQLKLMDDVMPPREGIGLSGIFLTHAHIGHYSGLMFLGHESAGANSVPVYAMPRMADFLENNGPWDQLVSLENIKLNRLIRGDVFAFDIGITSLSDKLVVVPVQVPHRDEYSETVGYLIAGPSKKAFFLPDIDDWDQWEKEQGVKITDIVEKVDYAFLDATFFDDNELPGRDMSKIPHPRVTESMDLFGTLSAEHHGKVHFIHYNHTNPIRDVNSVEYKSVIQRGFHVAARGDRHCLSD